MNTVKIYELYDDLWYKPWWLEPKVQYAALVFICLLLLVSFWFLYKKKRKAKVLSPGEQALAELRNLKPDDFHGYERHKEFYSRLTHILKRYFGTRFSLDLFDKTDYEALKDLKPYIDSSATLEKLEAIMNGAVWAKFSDSRVAQKKMMEHVEESITIVKNTEPFQVR